MAQMNYFNACILKQSSENIYRNIMAVEKRSRRNHADVVDWLIYASVNAHHSSLKNFFHQVFE
jgi:hypothetical protein